MTVVLASAAVAAASSMSVAGLIRTAVDRPAFELASPLPSSGLAIRNPDGTLSSSLLGQNIVFDAGGFEAGALYHTGSLVGQNSWLGYTAATAATMNVSTTPPVLGAQAVRSVGGSTATPVNAYTSPDNAPIVSGPGDIISVGIDMGRSVVAAASSTTYYSLGSYDSAGNEVAEMGLTRRSTTATGVGLYVVAPFNTTTSQFQAGQPVFVVTVSTGLSAGTLYNLTQQLNYATQTYSIYSGGSLFLGNIPFATATTTPITSLDFSDADLQAISSKGADYGAFDNYLLRVVPEPTTLTTLAAVGITALRRRR